jgi:outer membrane lipoprotein LolB
MFMLLMVGLLVGCAVTPEIKDPIRIKEAWRTRYAQLSQVRSWALKGRLAISVENEGWYAGMRWSQQDDHYDMEILGPLGRKVAWLEGGAQGVNLETSKGESAYAPDAESLMYQLLGWSLPLTGLRYWVLGIPSPQDHVVEIQLDDIGRLSRLRQSGWNVQYQRYQWERRWDLPYKMTLVNASVTVKMVVNAWQVVKP